MNAAGAAWSGSRPVTRPRRSAAAACIAALLLAGCATRPPPALDGESLSGRLSVRIAADAANQPRAVAVAFDLRGSPESGSIEFTSPLGSLIARARWGPGKVLLVTTQGEQHFDDLDQMTREVLGEAVPVAALFDWLRGRPWSGAPSIAAADGSGFEQLGWRVDLSRLPDSQVIAQRDAPPAVTLRAVLDRS